MTFKPDPANLTRRRDRKSREEAWLIFYDGYVHVGTIGLRSQSGGHSPLALAMRILSRQQPRRRHQWHRRRF
jgi:hypothetical protein